MADNMCGPASATKSFTQHFEQDRSRQQDRLRVPSAGGQGFRSPNPQAASPGFNTFQEQNATLPAMDQPGVNVPHSMPPPPFSAPPHFMAPGSAPGLPPMMYPGLAHGFAPPLPTHGPAQNDRSDWARQFNNSNPNMQQPGQQGGSGNFAPQTGPTMAPPFYRPGAPATFNPAHAMPHGQFMPHNPFMHGQPMEHEQDHRVRMAAEGQQEHPVYWDSTLFRPATKADLDADFEHEMKLWMQTNGPDQEKTEAQRAADAKAASGPKLMKADLLLDPLRGLDLQEDDKAAVMGQEPHKDAEQEQQQDQSGTNSELARVAQELVNSVSDNESPKFKNSAFLKLMQGIADHKVVLDGNTLTGVENSSDNSAHPSSGVGSHVTGLRTGPVSAEEQSNPKVDQKKAGGAEKMTKA